MSIYTEDRETFERQMLQPPHAARLMEHAGRFVGRLDSKDKDALLKVWLESETKAAITSVRNLIREIAKTKFAIMVGHTWFKEFSSLDENSMTVNYDGLDYVCKAELKDIEVKI